MLFLCCFCVLFVMCVWGGVLWYIWGGVVLYMQFVCDFAPKRAPVVAIIVDSCGFCYKKGPHSLHNCRILRFYDENATDGGLGWCCGTYGVPTLV